MKQVEVLGGKIVLFGSGETSATGRAIHEAALRDLSAPVRVALLETPAGFEPNSELVAGKVGEFLQHRLQNYKPRVSVIAARRKNSAHSPDDAELLEPMLAADYIFLGPGSPTYAVRQLKDTLAYHYLVQRHLQGAVLSLASAAAIAVSAKTLPVYEIYKVGEDLHWVDGLNLFGLYGLNLAIVPHWNNKDGGDELDTSHGFMGRARFDQLRAMLPAEMCIVGIDEYTALLIDFEQGRAQVLGVGSVTLGLPGADVVIDNGQSFDLDQLGEWHGAHPPFAIEIELPGESQAMELPEVARDLLERRRVARDRKDWSQSDVLRDELAAIGVQVQDTQEGQRWSLVGDDE